MTRTCWVYSEQELTPRAIDTIRKILNENGFEDLKFNPNLASVPSGGKVLVFGSRPPAGVNGIEFVHTYSVAQMMSKANAATVLVASLQLYFQGKHVPPAHATPVGTLLVEQLMLLPWDFDLPVVIDIETTGNLGVTHTPEDVELLSIALYQPSTMNGPVVLWSGRHDENGYTGPIGYLTLNRLSEFLPRFTKSVYHNGKFDTRVLNRLLGVKLCVWFDTMLAHHVLNHAAGAHGLKELAMRYFGAPDWEAGIGKYLYKGGHYERIPKDSLVQYNGWDVYWTYQLFSMLHPMIESDEYNQTAYLLESEIANLMLDVEVVGIPFHQKNASDLVETNQVIADGLLGWMRGELGKDDFKPGSPQQVKRAFADKYNLELASTGVEVLEELINTYGEGHPASVFSWTLLEWRKLTKQVSTYAKGWGSVARQYEGDEQLRVHPTFLVHGTSTGRLSSTSPNAQNMPREKAVRKIVGLVE